MVRGGSPPYIVCQGGEPRSAIEGEKRTGDREDVAKKKDDRKENVAFQGTDRRGDSKEPRKDPTRQQPSHSAIHAKVIEDVHS